MLKYSMIASLRGHKHVYSFSLFVSSKTRHHAELIYNFPLNTVAAVINETLGWIMILGK